MQLNDRRILITGATGGIGQLLCEQLDAKGACLLLNCLNPGLLAEMRMKMGSRHAMVVADISTQEGRGNLYVAARDFQVDMVINLAGILDFRWFEDQSPALIEKMLQVNLVGPMLLCHDLIPLLRNHTRAVILNVGSTFGSIGHPGFVTYCASKAGLRHFTEALARELADSTVRVQYIAPRATATTLNSGRVNDMNAELGNRSDPPALVASEIVQLLESGKPSRYLGWPEKLFIKVNGLLPGVVHKALTGKLDIIRRYARS